MFKDLKRKLQEKPNKLEKNLFVRKAKITLTKIKSNFIYIFFSITYWDNI